jgi:hypothetical protein
MADFDVHYDPITVNNSDVTVDLKGLDNVKTALTLATPEALKLETDSDVKLEQSFNSEGTLETTSKLDTTSKIDFAVTQPIETESRAELDIKPLALDQCLRISFGPLPPTCVRQPYQQRIGFTLFGVEVFGLNLSGESQVVVTEVPSRPHVVQGGALAVGPPAAPRQQEVRRAAGGGLKIRLDE